MNDSYTWDGWEDDRNNAVFDSEREYRYSLTRTWNPEKPTLAWIMLNPSTADETEDDPTIRRCLGYAKDWGYGEIVVVNLFALRATDPSELREHESPVGEDNDEHLRRVCEDADRVVAAWGANGDLQNRGREVARTLDADLYALGTTKDGHPVHPLYQPADAEPEPWDERALLAATDGGVDQPVTESEPEAVVCPNPECHIDQRWTRRGVLCCPECAAELVIACEMCNSGAIERVGGSPRCSDHVESEHEETTNEKGDRHENEARHILKRVYGAGVSKVGCRGVHDPFGFVDLIAMRPGEPVKFVQVKTNGFSAEARRKYRRRTRKLPTEHAVLEVWVRHDRQGWVLHEYDPEVEEFRQFHEINVCDRSDAGDEYRDFVERQEQLVTDGGQQPNGTEEGKYGDIRILPDELDNSFQEIDGSGDVKAKVWESDEGERRLYLRVRDHDDGRKFNEFSVDLTEGSAESNDLTPVEEWEQHNDSFNYEPPEKPPHAWSDDEYQELHDRVITRRTQWFCDECTGRGPISSLRKARRHVKGQHSPDLVDRHAPDEDELETATDGGEEVTVDERAEENHGLGDFSGGDGQ